MQQGWGGGGESDERATTNLSALTEKTSEYTPVPFGRWHEVGSHQDQAER